MMHTDTRIVISFGTRDTGISADEYKQAYNSRGAALCSTFASCQELISAHKVIFLRQVHGTKGAVITEKSLKKTHSFSQEGDFLITNLPGIGLGVLTADCLPLIIHDPVKQVIAAVHAGWRGSVSGIAANVVNCMKKEFSCMVDDLEVYCGPAAKSCCYAIDYSIIDQAKHMPNTNGWLIFKDNSHFLDLALYNQALLAELGLNPENIYSDYNQCTICNQNFYSYRRDKEQSGRQFSIVMLK